VHLYDILPAISSGKVGDFFFLENGNPVQTFLCFLTKATNIQLWKLAAIDIIPVIIIISVSVITYMLTIT